MVSEREWQLPMVVKFLRQEEPGEEKVFLFPAKRLISKIWLIIRFWSKRDCFKSLKQSLFAFIGDFFVLFAL
jgi:hypothetical protein